MEKYFDFSSKMAHSSIYAMTGKARFSSNEEGIKTQYNYYELTPNDPSEPIRTLLWTVRVHFGILQSFENTFEKAIAMDQFKWKISRDALEGKLSYYISEYKDIMEGFV
ncbi:MAG: hypothetical protein ABSG91_20055 [Syntrophobacteraceae bacterium]|jgi:hypothetical protein